MLPFQVRSTRHARGLVLGMLLAVFLAIVAFSNAFGRAEPSGRYRPELAPAALDTGCYPLPAGIELDFPLQVRSDRDVDGRRQLFLHFDLIDAETAREKLVDAFVEKGFRETPGSSGEVELRKPGTGRVSAVVEPLEGTTEDSIVRGTIALDLPVAELASDDPVCLDPYATKRFPDDAGEVTR